MKAVVHKTLDQNVLDAWSSLWKKSAQANYINGPQWFLSVIAAFHYNDYVIISVYNDDNLLGIAGLVKEKKYGVNFYTVAPSDFVCGSPFLLDVTNKGLLTTFTKQLLLLGNVSFENVPEPLLSPLKQAVSLCDTTKQSINLYFSIRKDEQGKVIIPKRSRLTNRIKGIEEKFEFRSFDGTTKEGLALIFAIDKQSSKEEKGYSTFADQNIKVFYQNLEMNFSKNFLVSILYYEKKPIAYYIGFIAGTTYYWSQNAYISEYGQYSPGKILLVKLIDFLGSKNITTINFGSGDYRMKRLLTDDHDTLYQVIITHNALVNWYIKTVNSCKLSLYNYLHSHPKLYTLYRKGKKLLQ